MPADESTTIAELRNLVRQFVSEREWEKFHAPKNLGMAMSIEVAELMEHFQWIDVEDSRHLVNQQPERDAIGEEVADIFCYILALANTMQIDLTSILHAKMEKNRQKYPVEVYRGRF